MLSVVAVELLMKQLSKSNILCSKEKEREISVYGTKEKKKHTYHL
jgi:hypothetical protein